jgi:hypothetical protein
LGLSWDGKEAFWYGGVGIGGLLFAVFLFLICQPVLPRTLHPFCFYLLFLFLGLRGGEILLLGIGPERKGYITLSLLLLSLLIVVPSDFFMARKRWRQKIPSVLTSCLSFWVVLVVQALLSDGLGRRLGFGFFQIPAGTYFVMGLMGVLLPWDRRE